MVLNEIGTEQVHQIPQASLSVDIFGTEDNSGQQFFFRYSCEGNCPVTYFNHG